jgi:hypothetical protein
MYHNDFLWPLTAFTLLPDDKTDVSVGCCRGGEVSPTIGLQSAQKGSGFCALFAANGARISVDYAPTSAQKSQIFFLRAKFCP